FVTVEDEADLHREVTQEPFQQPGEDLLFGGEVVVERRAGDAGGFDDVVHAGAVETPGREHRRGGRERGGDVVGDLSHRVVPSLGVTATLRWFTPRRISVPRQSGPLSSHAMSAKRRVRRSKTTRPSSRARLAPRQ